MKIAMRNLLFLASAVAAAPAALPQDQISTGNEPILDHAFKIDEYCSEAQHRKIVQAWADVKTLHAASYPIMWGHLEERFFGRDIKQRQEEQNIINTVFGNIAKLIKGENQGSITLSCKDVPNKENNFCSRVIQDGKQGQIGAYAVSDGNDFAKATIVLCSPFFAPGTQPLNEVEEDVRRNGPGDSNRGLLGSGTTLLHELTHLAPVSGTDDVIIKDQLKNDQNNDLTYGFYETEKLAWGTGKNFGPKRELLAARNADNYACYVASKWYQQKFFKEPAAVYKAKREGEPDDEQPAKKKKKAVNIVLSDRNGGLNGHSIEWRFVTSGPFDKDCTDGMDYNLIKPADGVDSVAKKVYPGGTFELSNVDGEKCEYKNDGTGNPGAVWCNGQGHGCGDAGRHETTASCGSGRDSYSERQVVTCEWEVDA